MLGLLLRLKLTCIPAEEACPTVQAEKHAGDAASEAEGKQEATVEEHAALAANTDALTPGKRWGARVLLMSGVNARCRPSATMLVLIGYLRLWGKA